MKWKPITVMIAIYKEIVCCCSPKYYVYRFQVITGNERGQGIDNTNVVAYRFINQGNTVAEVNGLPVVSSQTVSSLGIQVPGNDINLSNMQGGGNEVDVTLYKVKFLPPPPFVPADNCLVVISKVRASKKASEKASQMLPTNYTKPAEIKKYIEEIGTHFKT